jgi:hypothetical protein
MLAKSAYLTSFLSGRKLGVTVVGNECLVVTCNYRLDNSNSLVLEVRYVDTIEYMVESCRLSDERRHASTDYDFIV